MNKPIKNTIGLDIRNSSLTAVELSYTKKGLKVVNFARIDLEPDIVEENSIVINAEAFKEAVKNLLLQGYAGPFTSHNVIISIPEEKTFSHNFCIPALNIEDQEFIVQEAKDYIPIELSEAAVDFRKVGKCEKEGEIRVQFVAAHKNVIESMIQMLSEIGLKVIFVDIDKNSLLRACSNHFRPSEGGYMVLDINSEFASFSMGGEKGASFSQNSLIGGDIIIAEVKKALKLGTLSETATAIKTVTEKPEENEQIKSTMIHAVGTAFKPLGDRISEMVQIARVQEAVELKTIFVVGEYAKLPGIAEKLGELFPEVKVQSSFEYIRLDEHTESHYPMAIGLALRAILPEEPINEINLLPKSKKEELYNRLLIPVITKTLFAVFTSMAILTLFTGFLAARNFVNLKVSDREVEISEEKSQSPFLHSAAQQNQEKAMLASQMSALLADAIPGGYFMKEVDTFGTQGIELVSASYKLNTDYSGSMRIRAKTNSRESTENFIRKLEENPHFKEVISPLSNLTGKGERFINIDLTIDFETLSDDYRTLNFPELKNGLPKTDEDGGNARPKKPTVQPKTSTESVTETPSGENIETTIKAESSDEVSITEEGSQTPADYEVEFLVSAENPSEPAVVETVTEPADEVITNQ